LRTVFCILLWAVATAVFGLAIAVKKWTQRYAGHSSVSPRSSKPAVQGTLQRTKTLLTCTNQAATLLLVASIINWISCSWKMAYVIVFTLTLKRSFGTWNIIVDVILEFWFQFVVLVLLFVIGRKNHGGLWFNSQNLAAKPQYHGYADQPTIGHRHRP
jgi:ABC-type proline/glycine betaine transport system permease subunit